MPAERFYIDHFFQAKELHELKEAEFHHLIHVMRARVGDHIEIVNGKGALAQASLHNVSKNKASLYIESVMQEPEHPCRIILAQAIPKPNRLDFILEKGTELGVDEFWLFPGHLSIKKEFSSHQLERARLLTIAAMKQCGRLTLPKIEVKPILDKWPHLDSLTSFFGDIDPEASIFKNELLALPSPDNPILFFTGPESGFNEKEIGILKNLGAKGVKLHTNILRTDTASLVALSLISHWSHI